MRNPRIHLLGLLAFVSPALFVVTLTGCASSAPPHSMRDPQANFNGFKTFAWDTGPTASQCPLSTATFARQSPAS
jgi:hypothetical protein